MNKYLKFNTSHFTLYILTVLLLMVGVKVYGQERIKYVIIPTDLSYINKNINSEATKITQLNDEDIDNVERLLNKFKNEYNLELENDFDSKDGNLNIKELKIKSLSKYKFQFIPYKNKQGEIEVWVNAFCMTPSYWESEVVRIFDGGNCFFNLKINLHSKKCIDFRMNGYG